MLQRVLFSVHSGSTPDGPVMFMEVCEDALILRHAVDGSQVERWWYERLVNMTYSPKRRVLCIWRRDDDRVHMHQFHTRKCRRLYEALKSAMERAASRGCVSLAGRELGVEYAVHDVERNQGGLLKVSIDAIELLFAERQERIELANIKKCNTFGGNMFVLEEYGEWVE